MKTYDNENLNRRVRNINILAKDKKLAHKLQVYEIGAIFCYHRGHRVEYGGQRSADVLVEYLLELDEYPVEDINRFLNEYFD